MVGKKEETEKDMRELKNYNTKDNTIYMYSDGSVRYMTKEGTYAWVVANKTKNGQVKMCDLVSSEVFEPTRILTQAGQVECSARG